jgi:hypothetical protein
MNKPNRRSGSAASFISARIKSSTVPPTGFLKPAVSALLLLAMMAVSASAQSNETVNLSAVPIRVTVPLGFVGTMTVSNHVSIANGSNEVDLAVSGYPAGASGTLDKTAFTGSGGAILTLNLNNVTEGIYNLSLNATGGATNNLLIQLQVADIWSGASGSTLNWSDAGNWTNGTVPGPNDDVVFTAAGATTNYFATNNTPITSIVNQNMTVGSLRFAQYSTNLTYQNLQIDPNVSLAVTGTNGFTMLMDYLGKAQTNQMYVTITGQSGAMVVSNENANFAILIDGRQNNTLDMSGLGNFVADVNQVGLGDYLLYPNYGNLQTNGLTGGDFPQGYLPTVNLAGTNVIKAVYTDPDDYTNATNRAYAFILGNNADQASGSGQQILLSLGISNSFQMDSFCIGGFGAAGSSLDFNPALAVTTNIVGTTTNYVTNSMVAVFRNTNGGRMSMFCLADAGGSTPTPNGGNTKANGFNGVDFASHNGYVDALVDRFIMSRDRPNSGGGCTAQSKMELGAGIFNVNTAVLGDQEHGDQTNLNYCQATLTVSNTAVFQVNQDMELGYTTADPSDASTPGDTYGAINIGPGGTVIANNIGVGGVTKASGEVGGHDIHGGLNEITLTNGALLVVSNNIADSTPNGALGLFSFGGNSTLELFVNGNHSGPYVYVNDLTTSGSGNVIQIGGVTNLALPAQVPLVQYAAGTPYFTLSLPPGYSGTLINNGAGKTIDALITTGAPPTLAWRGYVNNNWDTTTKNWLDLNTGLHTNFTSLADVTFDDTQGVPTNINLAASSITPGMVTMTNNTLNYVISGSGSIAGSAPMIKTGTGSLDVEANTTLSVTVDQGLLTGSGTIFSANIGSGAAMLFSGNISGNVTCAGTGVSSATINGSLDVQAGGVFTNLNTINGALTLESGSFMDNSGNVTTPTGSTSTVGSNAFLLNLGSIGDASGNAATTLQVNGTLEDASGSGHGITMTQLSINQGATFIPGGDGIGTTYIYSDGVGTYPGRLTLNSGSTTIIKVSPGQSPANTMVFAGAQDYGPSQSGQDQNGCTLVITNIGATPFAAGQVFNVFGEVFGPFTSDTVNNTGASTNSYPIIAPPSPGPGLIWDLSHLWPNGYIGVINTPTVTLTNSFTFLGSTNVVTTFTWSTNVFQQWVLETQANPLNVGLSTNWSRIPGSWTNTAADLAAGFKTRAFTNSLATTNPAVFYRLVYP